MPLCRACVELARALSKVILAGSEQEFSEEPIRHGRPFSEVRNSGSNTCPLCRLLQRSCVREDENEPLDETFAAEIRPWWVSNTDSALEDITPDSTPEPRRLRLLYVTVTRHGSWPRRLENSLRKPVLYRAAVPLQIYAKRGKYNCLETLEQSATDGIPNLESEEPLKLNVWCRYRCTHTGSQEALSLCQNWLKTCLEGHRNCCSTHFISHKTMKSTQLPTRVIDVTPSDKCNSVRLMEINGQHGTWVALSHCWGEPEKRPLATTRANIGKHLEGLELSNLPKTFQHAVILTRAFGIRYLWIDSLCIVQDDMKDWSREKKVMGNIYHNATVTIAAAYAKDSSEGLLFSDECLSYQQIEKPQETKFDGTLNNSEGSELLVCEDGPEVTQAVTLPYFEGDKIMGSFSIAPWAKNRPPEKDVLAHSPLFKRAWVMQEWTLSRRTIIFSKTSILWSCRKLCVDERGNQLGKHVQRPSILNWENLIEVYTGMDLTYESDRLSAIEGLASSLQMEREDQYFAGMWPANLPEALLWKIHNGHVGKPSLQRSHLPSWTWASLEGPIGFQLSGEPFEARRGSGVEAFRQRFLRNILHEIALQPSGALFVNGLMTHFETDIFQFVARRKRTREKYERVFKQGFKGYSNCRQAGGSIHGEQMVVIPSDISSGSGYEFQYPELAGWATLDVDAIPEPGSVYCLAVKMEIDAVTRIGYIGNQRRELVKEDGYHVLVLRSVLAYGTLPRFVRIGIGVIQVSRRRWYQCSAEIV